MSRVIVGISLLALALQASSVAAQGKDPDLGRMQGGWEVVELVEDGKVIPREAIREWLPSGGKLDVAENAIIFQSPVDGKRHVKLFSLDATQSPKGIDIVTKEGKDAWGVFRFADNELVLCLTDADQPRPDAFSAKQGSHRLLMTLARRDQPAKAADAARPAETPKVAATALTDDQVRKLLLGTWRYLDSAGALVITFGPEDYFSTIREAQELRLFQKAFVQTPISAGTYSVDRGQLMLRITKSIHPERVNHSFPFAVRSISEKDLIFVDYMGRVGQATRVHTK